MRDFLELLRSDEGQDIAEYAVMLAVIRCWSSARFGLSVRTLTTSFRKSSSLNQ
jgi:hypothetical protein